jgi:hypothetical protein
MIDLISYFERRKEEFLSLEEIKAYFKNCSEKEIIYSLNRLIYYGIILNTGEGFCYNFAKWDQK